MTDKIEFPGGWAKLRDPQDVTERQRRPLARVQRLLAGSGVGNALIDWHEEHHREPDEDEMRNLLKPFLADDEMDLFESSNDQLILALVEEWSFDKPITVESIQDLPGRAYAALREACQPLLQSVLGQSDDDIEDPNSTFPASSG